MGQRLCYVHVQTAEGAGNSYAVYMFTQQKGVGAGATVMLCTVMFRQQKGGGQQLCCVHVQTAEVCVCGIWGWGGGGGGGVNSYAGYMFSVLTADGGITVMLCTCSDSRKGWGNSYAVYMFRQHIYMSVHVQGAER